MEEIQKNLLSILIMYPEKQYLIFRGLTENHFTNQYKTVFKECQRLYKLNKAIDSTVIVNNLGNEYFNLILELSDVPLMTKDKTEEYIQVLNSEYNKKNAIYQTKNLLLEIEQDKLSETETQAKYLEISKLFSNIKSKVKSVNMLQGFSELLDDLEKKHDYYKTGFAKLDNYVLIDEADYIIIGGRPSSGKTTFSLNLMTKMAAKYRVDFFSLETSSKKIFQKIASCGAKINIGKLLHSNLQDTDYNDLLTIANEYNDYNLKVIEASGMTVENITAKALQDKADIIFIDYLQLITEKGNRYEKVTEISEKLHTFAQKEKVTVFALSQLKRPELGKKVSEPTMADLRESGQIENDADAILLLHNPNPNPENEDLAKQERLLLIAKNKMGEVGRIHYNFYGAVQSFIEA